MTHTKNYTRGGLIRQALFRNAFWEVYGKIAHFIFHQNGGKHLPLLNNALNMGTLINM